MSEMNVIKTRRSGNLILVPFYQPFTNTHTAEDHPPVELNILIPRMMMVPLPSRQQKMLYCLLKDVYR